ncbi:hypothetical protein ABPG75_013502 [Micractinium tetrahymenae]
MSQCAALQAACMQLQHAARVSSGREAGCRSAQPPMPVSAAYQQQQASRRSGRPMVAALQASLRQQQCSGSSRARRRRSLAAAAAAAEATEEEEEEQQPGELAAGRPGYRSFQLEGCEFLVAEGPDGQLDLQDSYVNTDVDGSGSDGDVDYSSSAWRRPEGLETVAKGQRQYLVTPWYSYYPGDMIDGKEPKSWVWRYYFIPQLASEPEVQLSFDDIYVMDGKDASLARCEVHRLAPPGTPPQDLRLRIRDDVVTIDTIESIPDWEHAVKARINSAPALSQLEQQRLAEYLAALEEARKMGTIDEAEFETAYDVHWLAGMQAGGAGVQALGDSWEGLGGLRIADDGATPELEEDILGGWDEESLKDLVGEYDDEGEDGSDFEDFDSPAADY